MTDNRSESTPGNESRPVRKKTDGQTSRKPAAFRLDDKDVHLSEDIEASPSKNETLITSIPDAPGTPRPQSPMRTPTRGFGFGKWIAIGFGGLISLAFGLAIDSLIRDLFTRTDWLGWLGIGLAALAVLGLLGLMLREALSLMRIGKIDVLRTTLADAANADNAKAAQRGLSELITLYQERPETARGRQTLAAHIREVIDGRDLIILAERELLSPLDMEARRIVMNSAKRVSLVTAISPRALVDLLAVLFENIRVIRRLSALYGGRPGTLGFIRLARQVVTHLALTGGMAAGDSLVSQVLGHGLAARLSARLGEGVINGLLTARIGIAAIAVCRPAPFVDTNGPTVSDFMGELISTAEKEEKKKTN